jgi:uncharacterized protein (DUF2147 family)
MKAIGGVLGTACVVASLMLAWPDRVLGQVAEGVTGRWLTEDGRGVLDIQRCDESICGKIDWFIDPTPHDGVIPHDVQNPDPTLRGRPICGLTILYGFHRESADPRNWEEGRVYNPEDGNTYHAYVAVLDADHIKLRGYIFIPLLGQSQIWSRDTGHPPCKAG